MGDIDNDTKCGRDGCGHMASAHGDTGDGDNTGACSMEGCSCSAMMAGSSDSDDAAVDSVPMTIRVPREVLSQLRSAPVGPDGVVTLPAVDATDDASAYVAFLNELSEALTRSVEPDGALKNLPAGACFRTGCTHAGTAHLDLPDMPGMGKCTVNGCMCGAFMPPGAPGEPAPPEPPVTAAAVDGAPGGPGGEPDDDAPGQPDDDGFPYRALLCQEGVETSDGRYIQPYATKWRTPPLSLGYQDKTEHGGFADTAAINIGRIDAIVREPGAVLGTFDIWGTGVIDDDDPDAVKAAHKIDGRFLKGVSVDLAIFAAEVEITAVDEDGWPIGERFIVTDCEIGMATVTSFPAFGDCQIELTGRTPAEDEVETGLELPEVGDRIPIVADAGPSFTFHVVEPEHVEERATMTVLASGGPLAPPAAWFEQPTFSEEELLLIPPHLCSGRRNVRACPLTVTDDGRVYGHLASWFVEHTAMSGRRIKAPKGHGYSVWHSRGVVRTAEGTDVAVGPITLDGGHADLRLDWRHAIAHYDDTRSAVIDATVGDDAHGIWLAGALRPDVDELTLRRLRAASVSGDWRPLGRVNELVAACSVNTPGFPTMRVAIAASGASEDLVALVAAGALPTREEVSPENLLAAATAELAHARREREAGRLLRTIG